MKIYANYFFADPFVTLNLGDKLEEVRLSNPDLIKKYVLAVDQATGEINFLKLKSY